MQRTIFNTPWVSPFFKWFSLSWLKLTGWQVQGELPPAARMRLAWGLGLALPGMAIAVALATWWWRRRP